MCLRGMARVELPPNHCMRYNSVKGSAVPQNHIEAPALVCEKHSRVWYWRHSQSRTKSLRTYSLNEFTGTATALCFRTALSLGETTDSSEDGPLRPKTMLIRLSTLTQPGPEISSQRYVSAY